MNINWRMRELNLKIVYYGPGLSGKTTNLEQIHDKVAKEYRSEMVSIKTHGDRTLYFDFMQIALGKINGLQPKLHLYTVPGQVYYESSRRLVLRGVDGVVFVADSNPERREANKVSWESLSKQLASYNIALYKHPVVIQCNKQDLPNAVSPPILKHELSLNGFPVIPAVAIQGEGVLDTLKTITSKVIQSVQQQVA